MVQYFFKKNRRLRGMEIEDTILTVTEREEAVIENPSERRELKKIWLLIIISLLVLGGRVFFLDILRGVHYRGLAKDNRIRSIIIKAPRGKILDKTGQVLASNVPSIDAIVIPNYLPADGQALAAEAGLLSQILATDKGEIEELLKNSRGKKFEPVLIKANITHEQSLILAEKGKNLPGVLLENTAIRDYQDGLIFSPVIGYDGKITKEELAQNEGYQMTDYIGKTGLEKYYEKQLKGVNGATLAEVDSRGNVQWDAGVKPALPGSDLYLNIDEGLQKKIYDSIVEVLQKNNTGTAAAVAIDPRTGGVMALVSFPGFDNNLFAQGISSDDYSKLSGNKDLPLFNRVVSGEYPPGSTIKPAIAAAGLAEGIINNETTVADSSGAISVGSWLFRDWKAHGLMNVRSAIAESCDVFFYAVGGGYGNISGLGIDRIKKYLNLFGLGDFTGIDLPGEAKGLVPNEQWKQDNYGERWYLGDSYHAAIGQGFVLATPLQLANYIATVANGGTLFSPHIVNRVKKSDGSQDFINPFVVRKNFIPSSVIKTVREGMRQTVTGGTAQSLKTLPVEAAGKTGTAQFGTENKTHGWFVSFAPYDDPQIAMAVLVEGGGEGNSTALPITQAALEYYFKRPK